MFKRKLRRFYRFWLLFVLAMICIILPYIIRFHDEDFSCYSSDWGGFGSYFGGMSNIISIFIIYCALREQQNSLNAQQDSLRAQINENSRMNIEAGYNRLCSSISNKYYNSKEVYDTILNQIYKSINTSNTDVNSISWETISSKVYGINKNHIYIMDVFNTYSYLIRGIEEEKKLNADRKKHYLQNLIFSVPNPVNIIILSHLLIQDNRIKSLDTNDVQEYHDADIIDIIKKYRLFYEIKFDNKMFNMAKDKMLGYDDAKKMSNPNYAFVTISSNRSIQDSKQ